MSWTLEEIKAGQMEVTLADGSLRVYTWEEASHEPGWCKLDWVIADKTRGQLANASNVLDPTWEAPDGTIVPLDGFLDPYYQEVYLDSDSIPLFSKLVKELSADSVDDYVDTLEHEVWKYTVKEPNYGKAARRMYNVFRMNGKYKRGRLHPRAVRRAGDRAVPGLGADPDARRRRDRRATRSTPTRWSRRSTA